MKTVVKLTAWLAACLPAFAQADPIDWPGPVKEKIDEVLAVKTKAMALPGMRTGPGRPISKRGILGKQANELMDELGALVTDEELIGQLEKQAGSDIRARIVLWALDRGKRKGEYERFAEYYVNKPETSEAAIVYFTRPYLDVIEKDTDGFLAKRLARNPAHLVPRPGTWGPNPIDKDDQIEKNRLIMEYCYFMPPAGRAFGRDNWRAYFSRALFDLLPNDKSLLVFKEDARIALKVVEENELENFPSGASYSFGAFREIVTMETFSVLSELRTNLSGEKMIRIIFNENWGGVWATYPESLENHRSWTALAKRPWKRECEKEFAAWILSVPEPKDPYPPKQKQK